MELAEQVRIQAQAMLGRPGPMSHQQLNEVLRLFAKYRSLLIQNTLLGQYGAKVLGGPFVGMDFVSSSAEGCHVAKLLGCYERELHDWVEAIVAENYEVIVNIGCADGYYSVGFARRCPLTKVFAFDINPIAQKACRELAGRNGVAERVEVGGLFSPDSFRSFRGRRTLVMIDIEGGELELLEGIPASELASFDLMIECHDCFQSDISVRLMRHFSSSHRLRLIKNSLPETILPPLFEKLANLDQLLATWEWRVGPTPWIFAGSTAWPTSGVLSFLSGVDD